jgi:hypothetical protein
MTTQALPKAAHDLTEDFRRLRLLGYGAFAMRSWIAPRNTILSRIIRLRLSYNGTTAECAMDVTIRCRFS